MIPGNIHKKVPDELDLHGLTVNEAMTLVDTFLYQSHKAGLYRVWVIYGIYSTI
jgi:DNA-nicking Smr family endonuclease